jgi:hypothetical protein
MLLQHRGLRAPGALGISRLGQPQAGAAGKNGVAAIRVGSPGNGLMQIEGIRRFSAV